MQMLQGGRNFDRYLKMFAESKDVEDPFLKVFIRFAFMLCVFELKTEISSNVRNWLA